MPELKPISGHTGCARIQQYLEKNDRAIAKDFFNLEAWDERDMEGYDESLKGGICWAEEMDSFREEWGNHLPVGGMRARTFKHFVLSPDPEDGIGLEQLREMTRAWVLRFWPDYQVAIVYHDDNAGRIPHAHIVVNNTNIVTHRRMQTANPLELNQALQDMARERGLHGMSNVIEAKSGVERLAAKDEPDVMTEKTPRTRRAIYLGRKEKEIVGYGGYSWVADIRNRVSIARSLARDLPEFERLIGTMDLNMAENSAGARRRDWVFSLADEPTKKVTGERLGYMFGKEALERRFDRIGSYRPSQRSAEAIALRAESAIALNDIRELEAMSQALEVSAKYGIRSIEDFDAQLARATKPEQIEAISEAKGFMARNRLMPLRVAKKPASQSETRQTEERRRDDRFYQQQAARQREARRERGR